jgi:hypothetical protein
MGWSLLFIVCDIRIPSFFLVAESISKRHKFVKSTVNVDQSRFQDAKSHPAHAKDA